MLLSYFRALKRSHCRFHCPVCVLRAVLHHRDFFSSHNEYLLFLPLPYFLMKVKSHTDSLPVLPLTPVPKVLWPHTVPPGWEVPRRCRWKFSRHRRKSSGQWGTTPALVTLYSLLEHSLKNMSMSGLGHLMLQPAQALLPSGWSNLHLKDPLPHLSIFNLAAHKFYTVYSLYRITSHLYLLRVAVFRLTRLGVINRNG